MSKRRDKVGEGTHGAVFALGNSSVMKTAPLIDKRSFGTYLSDGVLTELAALCRVATSRHVVTVKKWRVRRLEGRDRSELQLERLAPLENIDADMLRSGARNYIRQLMEALADIHALGVAHCDIKLDNVMYDVVRDEMKLIDFGLAKIDHEIKPPDKAMFTFDYRPPEALLCCANIDLKKADVWAAGVCAASIMFGMGHRSIYYRKMHDLGWKGALDVILRSTDARLPALQCKAYVEYMHSREGVIRKNPGYLWRKLEEVAGADAVDLIRRLMDPDPTTRASPAEALSHPYLQKSPFAHNNDPPIAPSNVFPPTPLLVQSRLPADIVNEVLAASEYEDLCPETAFKTLDILTTLTPEESSDRCTVASAIAVASAVGENRLIRLDDLFSRVAPWVGKHDMIDSINALISRPGTIAILASRSVLEMTYARSRTPVDKTVIQRLFYEVYTVNQ